MTYTTIFFDPLFEFLGLKDIRQAMEVQKRIRTFPQANAKAETYLKREGDIEDANGYLYRKSNNQLHPIYRGGIRR